MPVARETTSAISSAPTSLRSSLNCCPPPPFSAACSCSSSLRNCTCWILAASSYRPLRWSAGSCAFSLSISALIAAEPCTAAFSARSTSSRSAYSLSSRTISSSIVASRLREASSVSFFTASRSIFSWISRRSSLSIASGFESISILMRAAASSIRSIALSGRKRSVT